MRGQATGKVSLKRNQVPEDKLSGEECTPPNLAELKVGSPLFIQRVREKHSPHHGKLSDRFSGRASFI